MPMTTRRPIGAPGPDEARLPGGVRTPGSDEPASADALDPDRTYLFYAMGGSTGWQAPTEGLAQAELRPENSCLAPGDHRCCELDERPAHL